MTFVHAHMFSSLDYPDLEEREITDCLVSNTKRLYLQANLCRSVQCGFVNNYIDDKTRQQSTNLG